MTKERLHESQLRNVRKWAESKPHMYGSSAIIDLIDELMERRAADTLEPGVGESDKDKLARVQAWLDTWAKPPSSDANQADMGWYWAAQEVQELLDPDPEAEPANLASQGAKSEPRQSDMEGPGPCGIAGCVYQRGHTGRHS